MLANEIVDQKSFETWLNARPQATRGWVAACLSWRIAARSLSFTLLNEKDIFDGEKQGMNSAFFLTSVSLRANAIARAMTLAPARAINMGDSALFAARSADFAALSADSALSAARSADSALSAARSADSALSDSALSATRSALWGAIALDCAFIENKDWKSLNHQPLWPANIGVPDFWKQKELAFREALKTLPNQHVWLRWHNRIVQGKPASEEIELLYADEALDALWEKEDGFSKATAWIAERLEAIETKAEEKTSSSPEKKNPQSLQIDISFPDIASIASPKAVFKTNGKIGLGTNEQYDQLDSSDKSIEIFEAQASAIKTIIDGLPSDAPKHLKTAFNEYLLALPLEGRVAKALVIDLQFSVIVREIASTADGTFITKGLVPAFKAFKKYHPKVRKDAKDNKRHSEIAKGAKFDENKSQSDELRNKWKNLDEKLLEAVAAGIADEELATQSKQDLELFDNLRPIDNDDRFQPKTDEASPRKKFFIARYGYINSLVTVTAIGGGATAMLKDGSEALKNLGGAALELLKLIEKLFI